MSLISFRKKQYYFRSQQIVRSGGIREFTNEIKISNPTNSIPLTNVISGEIDATDFTTGMIIYVGAYGEWRPSATYNLKLHIYINGQEYVLEISSNSPEYAILYLSNPVIVDVEPGSKVQIDAKIEATFGTQVSNIDISIGLRIYYGLLVKQNDTKTLSFSAPAYEDNLPSNATYTLGIKWFAKIASSDYGYSVKSDLPNENVKEVYRNYVGSTIEVGMVGIGNYINAFNVTFSADSSTAFVVLEFAYGVTFIEDNNRVILTIKGNNEWTILRIDIPLLGSAPSDYSERICWQVTTPDTFDPNNYHGCGIGKLEIMTLAMISSNEVLFIYGSGTPYPSCSYVRNIEITVYEEVPLQQVQYDWSTLMQVLLLMIAMNVVAMLVAVLRGVRRGIK